jgi:hypothetical protein
MSKHRAPSPFALGVPRPPARPRPTTHRAPVRPSGVTTVRRAMLAGLLLAVAFPVVGAAGLGAGWSHSSLRATATRAQPLSPLRPQDAERPADRGSRPSPPASLMSAAESLAAAAAASSAPPDAALSSPVLGPVLSGVAGVLQIAPSAAALAQAHQSAVAAQSSGAGVQPKTGAPAKIAAATGAATPTTKASTAPVVAAAPTTKAPVSAPYVAGPAGYPFGSSSVWRHLLGSASVASNSSTLVATLANSVSSLYNGVAAFNVDSYNTTFYSVAASTPRADVIFTDCQGKGSEPAGLADQFSQVPIPSNAVPADGSDAELTIYSASSDQLWEFWQASHASDGWHACWGGRIDHVSTSPGYFTGGFGATATGLPVAGGMVSIADATAGVINHAMSLEIPNPASWNDFSYPAQRSDGGNSSSSAIPEGTRFRLDPSVNVNSLNLSPLAKMIAKAAQTYGFIVTDQSGAVAVQAQSAAGASSDPWPALMAGVPSYQILANFPWGQLQALPQNWGE